MGKIKDYIVYNSERGAYACVLADNVVHTEKEIRLYFKRELVFYGRGTYVCFADGSCNGLDNVLPEGFE